MHRILKVVEQNNTISSKFDEFIQQKTVSGLRQKTIDTYKNHFHVLFGPASCFDPDISPADVNWDDVIMYIRTKNVTESTKNSYLRTLKTFMNWLGETNLPVLRKVETAKELYTTEELQKLLQKPDMKTCTYAELRTWCIITLVYDTGLRASSIRNLKVSDIDFENKIVTVRHTKTHKVQILPFSDASKNALKALLRHSNFEMNNYLFETVYGLKMSENGLAEAIIQYNHSRGVEKTSIHLLRHNFARAWVQAGQDPFSLQMMLGHSGLEMTRHYCQLYSNDLIAKYISPVEVIQKKQIKLR